MNLALGLRDVGVEVVFISPAGDYTGRIMDKGFRWRRLDISNRSINPFVECRHLITLYRIYKEENPSVVHHFTIKCVIYGSLVCRWLRIPVINSITGLGHIFTDSGQGAGIRRVIVSIIYRWLLKNTSGRIIFQNRQDRQVFLDRKLVAPKLSCIIRGSGVDLEKFKPSEKRPISNTIKVVFASRLIREKGVFEYIEAAKTLRSWQTGIEFILAGDIFKDNPSSLSEADLDNIKHQQNVNFIGMVDNMPKLLADADIVVLPTYYGEGTPKILIEAAAMAKPVVATEIAGCMGLVEHGVNGYLVPTHDVAALADAICRLAVDAEKRTRFGQAGRRIVERHFSDAIVNAKTIDIYRELLNGIDTCTR